MTLIWLKDCQGDKVLLSKHGGDGLLGLLQQQDGSEEIGVVNAITRRLVC